MYRRKDFLGITDLQQDNIEGSSIPNNDLDSSLDTLNSVESLKDIGLDTIALVPDTVAVAGEESSVNYDYGNTTIKQLNNNNNTDEVKRKFEEGYGEFVYKDTEGFLTVGYGHKLTREEIKSGKFKGRAVSREEAQAIYEEDEAREQGRLNKAFPKIKTLPKEAQSVLRDMAFNMGGSFIKSWVNLKRQLLAGDFKGAANNIRTTRYYKQVPNRAERNAKILETL